MEKTQKYSKEEIYLIMLSISEKVFKKTEKLIKKKLIIDQYEFDQIILFQKVHDQLYSTYIIYIVSNFVFI